MSAKVVLDVFEGDIFPKPSFRNSGRDALSAQDLVHFVSATVTKSIAGSLTDSSRKIERGSTGSECLQPSGGDSTFRSSADSS